MKTAKNRWFDMLQNYIGARTHSVAFLGPEFNDFLYAPIGRERNGDYLSVISAMARLDLDPWAEASQLAKLPAASATQKLTSFIDGLQKTSAAPHVDKMIASRLIALLPGHTNTKTAAKAASVNAAAKDPRFSLLFFVVSMTIMLSIQVIMHAEHPPKQNIVPHTIKSSTVPPQITPPSDPE
jgi:hypothetical protein